jgi:hypothetical protein
MHGLRRFGPEKFIFEGVRNRTVLLPRQADSGCYRDFKIANIVTLFSVAMRSVRGAKKVKRPIGVTIIAVLTFLGAAILALGAVSFFFVAFLGMTGGDSGDPASVAIAGMGIAGGFSLLVLAGVAGCLAIGVLELREWARIVSVATIGSSIGFTILSLFAVRRYVVLPAVPSIYFHLLVVTTAVWMLAYLSLPRVKRVFSAVTAQPAQ